MRIITENLMKYIKNEIEQIEFGSVTIKLNGTSNKVDVVTESRQRFVSELEKDCIIKK